MIVFLGIPSEIDIFAVEETILKAKGVLSFHDLHIWAIGTTEIALSDHIVASENYQNPETAVIGKVQNTSFYESS